MQYQLTIDLTTADVTSIDASGQTITLVKSSVSNPLSGNNLPVAWLGFSPWETNTVTWEEEYLIYASTTELASGATIVQTSSTDSPVQLGWTYTLQGGEFSGSIGGGSGTFTAANEQNGLFTFGLAQSALVNGVNVTAPLNAVSVANNETASFTTEETVSVFLSATQNNGVVLSQVASNALQVNFTSQAPSATVKFNPLNNTFYQA